MSRQEFTTPLESGERGRIFINIPFDPVEKWGKKARYYVKGTLNGTDFRGSLGTRDKLYFMPVNKELQKAAGIAPGDSIKVLMEPDDPQREEMPDDFAAALKSEPEAERFFKSLTPFYANTYIEWITSAKKEETRTTRLREALTLLKAGKRQR